MINILFHRMSLAIKFSFQFSDEIKRLQAHEMSLEEMENEDSTYIQEAKLKRKAMLVKVSKVLYNTYKNTKLNSIQGF